MAASTSSGSGQVGQYSGFKLISVDQLLKEEEEKKETVKRLQTEQDSAARGKKLKTSEVELPVPDSNETDPEVYSLLQGMVSTVQILEGLVHVDSENSGKIAGLVQWCEKTDPCKLRVPLKDYEEIKNAQGRHLELVLKSVENCVKKELKEQRSFKQPQAVEAKAPDSPNSVTTVGLGYASSSQVPDKIAEVVERDSVFQTGGSKPKGDQAFYDGHCRNCSKVVTLGNTKIKKVILDVSQSTESLCQLFTYLSTDEYYSITDTQLLVLKAGDGGYPFGACIFGELQRVMACESNKAWHKWLMDGVMEFRQLENVDVRQCSIPATKDIREADIVILTKRATERLEDDEWRTLIQNMEYGTRIVSYSNYVEDSIMDPEVKKEWEARIKLEDSLLFEGGCDNCKGKMYHYIYRVETRRKSLPILQKV